jgi:hypothetical protein
MKLKFKEVIENGNSIYYIDEKEVSKDAYNTLFEDENNHPDIQNNFESETDNVLLPEEMELYDYIIQLSEMDIKDAINDLNYCLNMNYDKGFLEGQKVVYENLQNVFARNVFKLEQSIEDLEDEYNQVSEDDFEN